MTEAAYIDKLRALWPRLREDQDSAMALLALAEEALSCYPTSPKLLCILGDLIQLSDGDRYKLIDALSCYERAIAFDPLYADAHESIGYYCDVAAINLPRAEGAFRRAIELGAGESSYLGLARVIAEQGRSKESMELLVACPYHDSLDVHIMRDEIEAGNWSPVSP